MSLMDSTPENMSLKNVMDYPAGPAINLFESEMDFFWKRLRSLHSIRMIFLSEELSKKQKKRNEASKRCSFFIHETPVQIDYNYKKWRLRPILYNESLYAQQGFCSLWEIFTMESLAQVDYNYRLREIMDYALPTISFPKVEKKFEMPTEGLPIYEPDITIKISEKTLERLVEKTAELGEAIELAVKLLAKKEGIELEDARIKVLNMLEKKIKKE